MVTELANRGLVQTQSPELSTSFGYTNSREWRISVTHHETRPDFILKQWHGNAIVCPSDDAEEWSDDSLLILEETQSGGNPPFPTSCAIISGAKLGGVSCFSVVAIRH
jgi:hypothetical protein